MKEDDQLLAYRESNLQHITLVFTDKGRYMYIPNHQLPEIRWKDLGTHISQIVPIDGDERVIHMITVTDFNSDAKILAATRNGMIKLSSLKDFEVTRYSRPLINMKLKDNDVVNTIHVVTGSEHILVVTKQGMSLHYSLTELNDTGLKAAGVKSINLKDNDVVITTEIIYPESSLLIATQRGAMKKWIFNYLKKENVPNAV